MSRLITQSLFGAVLAWTALTAHANTVQTHTTVEASPISDLSNLVRRDISGSGSIGDGAIVSFGENSAEASALVDQFGLHTSAVIHADPSNSGQTAKARAYASFVTPFMIVPGTGFSGTTAHVSIPYFLEGTLSLSCLGYQNCNGAARVSGGLSVSGLGNIFTFDNVLSNGTSSTTLPNVSQSGFLSGDLPVNTELSLVANLQSYAQGQALDFVGFSIHASSLFGSTLSFQVTSTDNVNIVFPGLTIAPVPEPELYAMFLVGLGVIALRRRDCSAMSKESA